jgi:hypothetical protein
VNETADPLALSRRLDGFELDGVVVRTSRIVLAELVSTLVSRNPDVPVFVPWIPGLEPQSLRPQSSGTVVTVEPFERRTAGRAQRRLEEEFVRRWGEAPTSAAAYAYDAARLIIEGLRAGGTGRADLRRALSHADGLELAGGPLHLDNGGGNLGRPVIVELRSLAPVEIARVVNPVKPHSLIVVSDTAGR